MQLETGLHVDENLSKIFLRSLPYDFVDVQTCGNDIVRVVLETILFGSIFKIVFLFCYHDRRGDICIPSPTDCP